MVQPAPRAADDAQVAQEVAAENKPVPEPTAAQTDAAAPPPEPTAPEPAAPEPGASPRPPQGAAPATATPGAQ